MVKLNDKDLLFDVCGAHVQSIDLDGPPENARCLKITFHKNIGMGDSGFMEQLEEPVVTTLLVLEGQLILARKDQ